MKQYSESDLQLLYQEIDLLKKKIRTYQSRIELYYMLVGRMRGTDLDDLWTGVEHE